MAPEGVRVQRHAPAALYPRERPCLGPRAGLNRCGKSRPTGIWSPELPARRKSIIPTALPGPLNSSRTLANQTEFYRLYLKSLYKRRRNSLAVLRDEYRKWSWNKSLHTAKRYSFSYFVWHQTSSADHAALLNKYLLIQYLYVCGKMISEM